MRRHTLLFIPLFAVFLTLPVYQPAIGRGVDKFYQLTPEEVAGYTHLAKGRKAVMLYASWCGYCRRAMPEIIALEKRRPGSIIAVSVDKTPKKLMQYLAGYPEIPFHVIILKDVPGDSLEQRLGARPNSGVPRYILLDENNNVSRNAYMQPSDVARYILGP